MPTIDLSQFQLKEDVEPTAGLPGERTNLIGDKNKVRVNNARRNILNSDAESSRKRLAALPSQQPGFVGPQRREFVPEDQAVLPPEQQRLPARGLGAQLRGETRPAVDPELPARGLGGQIRAAAEERGTTGLGAIVETAKETIGGFGAGLSEASEVLDPIIERITGIDPVSTEELFERSGIPTNDAGKFLGKVASLIPAFIAGGAGANAARTGLLKIAPGLAKQGGTLGNLGKFLLTRGVEGAAGTAAFEAATLQAPGTAEVVTGAGLNILLSSLIPGGKAIGRGARALQRKLSGVDDISTVINPTGGLSAADQAKFINTTVKQPERAKSFEKFLAAAEQNAANPRAKGALALAEDSVEQARNSINTAKRSAGKIQGEALKASQGIKAKTGKFIKEFQDDILERFNVKISAGKVTSPKGRVSTLQDADLNRLKKINNEVRLLSQKETSVGKINDIKKRLDGLINRDLPEPKKDTLNKFVEQLRGKLNKVQQQAAPELAKANAKFAELAGLEKDVFKAAGGENQKAVTILKKALNERGEQTRKLFDRIAKETNIDLFEDSVFAKFSAENLGGSQAKSRLVEILEEATPTAGLIRAGITTTRKIFADPVAIARKIAQDTGVSQSIVTKAINGATQGIPREVLQAIQAAVVAEGIE